MHPASQSVRLCDWFNFCWGFLTWSRWGVDQVWPHGSTIEIVCKLDINGIQFLMGINTVVRTSNQSNIVLTTTRHREHNFKDRKGCTKITGSRWNGTKKDWNYGNKKQEVGKVMLLEGFSPLLSSWLVFWIVKIWYRWRVLKWIGSKGAPGYWPMTQGRGGAMDM